MNDQIYVFKGEAVAESAANRRPGARHALVVFANASTLEAARAVASSAAEGNGWVHVTFDRGAEVNVAPSDIDDGYLRSALVEAMEVGRSIVAYVDELPSNA